MSAKLEEIPALQAWHTVNWTPLRNYFGISAFGVNLFAVDNAGETVITPHSEEEGDPPRAHEELYIVLSGRATFTAGDTEIDAPAGTCVYVGDPAAERAAVAREDDTRVLVVGGKPGVAFKPSAWEFAAGVYAHYEAKEYDAAIALAHEGLQLHPDDARLVYNLACVEAITGEAESALAHLVTAVRIRPDLAEVAAHDDDFGTLRGDRRFPVSAA